MQPYVSSSEWYKLFLYCLWTTVIQRQENRAHTSGPMTSQLRAALTVRGEGVLPTAVASCRVALPSLSPKQ